jgi:hypothetical protein
MTPGEKMVWAAFYSQEYAKAVKNPPSDCLRGEGSGERWKEWEMDQASSAIEGACYAVKKMRMTLSRISEGFGSEHHVTQMLRAMLEV